MKIIIRKGVVKKFVDNGNQHEQLKNYRALVDYTQQLAAEMHIVADSALSVNPQLVELNKHLNAQVRAAQNTVKLADKQLERNAKNKTQEVAQKK
jgi:hypothetical protein